MRDLINALGTAVAFFLSAEQVLRAAQPNRLDWRWVKLARDVGRARDGSAIVDVRDNGIRITMLQFHLQINDTQFESAARNPARQAPEQHRNDEKLVNAEDTKGMRPSLSIWSEWFPAQYGIVNVS